MRSINEIVAAELGMYPKGGLAQNIFRAAYQNLRANSLGRKRTEAMTADTVRHRAIDLVRIHFPDFTPRYVLGSDEGDSAMTSRSGKLAVSRKREG